MDLVPYAVPFFLAAILLEFAWGLLRGRNTYRLNDTINSLSLGVLSTATKLLGLNLAGPVFGWVQTHLAPMRLDPGSVSTWIGGVLLYDLCYYWFHRISHERTLFWASHVVHHQSEEFNLSTALRQTSTGFLVAWVFYIPCFLVGIPAEVFVTIGSAHLIYQFWIHSRHIPKLGVLEWFLVTASNHRVHHARNPAYVDTNYGGLLIIWDRLFGTFREEREEEPCVYGITTPLRSWSPLLANLHIYRGMASDAASSGSLTGAMRVLSSRTGWHPAGARGKAAQSVEAFSPYDPPTTPLIRAYAALQFLVAAAFSLWMEQRSPGLDGDARWALYGYLLLWLCAIGAILDRRRSGLAVEVVRLCAAVVLGVFLVADSVVHVALMAYAGLSVFMLVGLWRDHAGGRASRPRMTE